MVHCRGRNLCRYIHMCWAMLMLTEGSMYIKNSVPFITSWQHLFLLNARLFHSNLHGQREACFLFHLSIYACMQTQSLSPIYISILDELQLQKHSMFNQPSREHIRNYTPLYFHTNSIYTHIYWQKQRVNKER